ncbi:MAG: major capsid family protein [Lysobacterales bacterium]
MTILEFIRANNVYSAQIGAPLTIRATRKLDEAGVSGAARMIAYRRSPEVLKLHVPMPHRFLPVWQSGPLRWEIPGVMRLGGLDIRLPNEVSYVDGI